MKAIITLATGLMIMSTAFAQSSRRSEVKENNSEPNNNRRTESVSTERRTPTERASRTEEATTSRRSDENSSSPNVRRAESPSPQVAQQPSGESSNSNRRSSSDESKASANENSRVTSSSRTPGQQPATKTYDDNRRTSRNNAPEQTTVQESNRRAVETRRHEVVHKSYRPVPVEVRRVKSPYRAPVRTEVIWTVDLSRRIEVYYPHYRPHRYHVGMRLATVSAYDAYGFVGEIARVYGRVIETYYAWETDEYFLYFGDYYPYHDFSIIIPGREARDFSRRPERFFERQYVEVTGLVSRFEGKPEMIVKRSSQIAVY